MPPFIGRKRLTSASPPNTPKAKKPSLFDIADKPTASSTVQDNKAFLDSLGGSDSETSLSDVSSSDFEDVVPQPASKKRKTEHEYDDEEVDWEDAIQETGVTCSRAQARGRPLGDLELTLDKGAKTGFLADSHGKKKGPSKIERQIRVTTHCMHVQFLLFHNLVRNGWACDKEVQATLVGQLPPGVKREIDRWKAASGVEHETQKDRKTSSRKGANDSLKGGKTIDDVRSQREWGKPAERQEKGAPNMSSGDPILRLLRILAAYWKKRFTITMPSLRKQGYKSLAQLEAEIASFKNDRHNAEEHGERIDGLKDFLKIAKTCEGSRDVGAQLFVALIRGLGLEARLVASLQPVGFGWGKSEVATGKKKKENTKSRIVDGSAHDSSSDVVETPKPSKTAAYRKTNKLKNVSKGEQEAPIGISEDSAAEDQDIVKDGDDDESVVDVTPSTPRRKPNKHYDSDVAFPTYWTEVISPITNEVYPVEPFLLNPPVANNPEHLASFEPRGAKADKAKLVIAYVVAYDGGGCAKEVTTRYLKRHMWPGRTRGVRMPVEKIPVYSREGKVKHNEDYDWFKTVMSGYRRPHHMRTAVDDLEEAKDLKAVKPEKREVKQGEDTLQGYKTSAEYVLERHLRREEALRPGAKPVKYFTAGKGDKAKDEPVFLRQDVMICRTGESWHKEGRQVKGGEHPMKMVPVRAVTLTRKREVEEAERDCGEKLKQGMYSRDQTEYIIPPPIENGIIPKNAYGNMDCFVPSMVPKGAVHIPLKKTMTICKRLGINYAEAVTGFEFGNKRAVPVVTGVVVAAENENLIIDEWKKDEEERKRKEEGKREKVALATWRKFLMGLRIVERVRDEYGGDAGAHLKEEMNPFTNQSKARKSSKEQRQEIQTKEETSNPVDEDMAGGFMVDDASDVGVPGGGFLPDDHKEPEEAVSGEGGGFLSNGDDGKEPAPGDEELIFENGDAVPRKAFNTFRQPFDYPGLPSPIDDKVGDAMDVDSEEPLPVKRRGRPKGTAPKTPKIKAAKKGNATPKTANGSTPKGHQGASESEDDEPASKRNGRAKANRKAEAALKTTNGLMPNSHPETSNSQTDVPASEGTSKKKPARRAPTRKAARNSASAVKSHYFDHSSEEEQSSGGQGGSEDDATIEFKPQAKTRKARKVAHKAQGVRRKTSGLLASELLP